MVAAVEREDAGLMDATSIPIARSRRHRSSLLYVGIWLDWMARHPLNAPYDMNRRVLYWWLVLLQMNGGLRAQEKGKEYNEDNAHPLLRRRLPVMEPEIANGDGADHQLEWIAYLYDVGPLPIDCEDKDLYQPIAPAAWWRVHGYRLRNFKEFLQYWWTDQYGNEHWPTEVPRVYWGCHITDRWLPSLGKGEKQEGFWTNI